MKFLSIIFTITCALLQVKSKIYTKCEFAKTMDRAEFPRDELPDWVCLVQHESNFNTEAINKENTDGSYDWGIFQVRFN